MGKENELTKYEGEQAKEMKASNDALVLQKSNVEALNGANKNAIEALEKEFASKKESCLDQIAKIEEKCQADILAQNNSLEENLAKIKADRQENRNTLTKNTNEVKKVKANDVETITAERNKIEEDNKAKVAEQLAKYNKIVNSTNKEIAKLEEANKASVAECEANYNALNDSLNEKIKETNNAFFQAKKKAEDKAKKEITAKNNEIAEKNKTLDEKITFVGKEFLGNQKSMQEIISSTTSTKVQISEANKKLKEFTNAKNKEILNLNKDKNANEQERLLFEKKTNDEMEKEISAKRIETIDLVTKIQGELDVNAQKIIIDKANLEDDFKNNMNALLLRQLKEKLDNDIANNKQSNIYELALEQQRNRSLTVEKLENLGVESIRVDREYDEASFDGNVLDANKNAELTKETIVRKAEIEKETYLAQIDFEELTLKHSIKEIKLNEQNQTYEFMKPVYTSYNETLNKATSIVNDFKKKRMAKATVPFIDAINKKLENFTKRYNDLISEQQDEYTRTVDMMKKSFGEKMDYIRNSKTFIETTDGTVVSCLNDLEKKEIALFEDSLKQINETNDNIIKLYNDKIIAETKEAQDEIDRINKLNDEINAQIDANNQNEKETFNTSSTNIAKYALEFAKFYSEGIKMNDKYSSDNTDKRKNTLDTLISNINENVKNFADNILMDKKEAVTSLDQLADSCNLSRENLKNEYDRFINKNTLDFNAFESQLNIQLSNLEAKTKEEYLAKEKEFADDLVNRDKDKQSKIKEINVVINKINKKIPSKISFNNKNANIEKNKKWWIVEN